MKIALISDLHGNLEALNVVVNNIRKQSIKKIICLGDLVGYGANPNECIEIVSEVAEIVIAGNHDWAVLDKTDYSNFNPVAKAAIEWTKKNTKTKNLEYLNRLAISATTKSESFLLVHSTPKDPEKWHYLFDVRDFEFQLNYFEEKCCFIGHSHEPLFFNFRGSTGELCAKNPLKLEKKCRYIINVGSIGQPRDYDPRAAYMIVDTNSETVELIRLPYDIPTAQKKIIEAGLPEFLALRLARGQ